MSLAGDACHVTSGTTSYEWDGVPEIWQSAIWFPFLVGGAILAGAYAAERAPLPPPVRVRRRVDVPAGAGAVLALYALTAALRGEPTTVAVVLTGAIAIAIWSWWDPSPRALALAVVAAVLGPLAEIVVVGIGAASYARDADELGGVGPWLPAIYFAAGAVASSLWAAVERDGHSSVGSPDA